MFGTKKFILDYNLVTFKIECLNSVSFYFLKHLFLDKYKISSFSDVLYFLSLNMQIMCKMYKVLLREM